MKFLNANIILISVLLAAVIVLAGCLNGQQNPAENETENGDTQTSAGNTHSISIKDNAYSSTSLTINVGDSVEWTNLDGRVHQVKILEVSSSPVLIKDGTWTYIFYEKGAYEFRDAELPYMTGTIMVG